MSAIDFAKRLRSLGEDIPILMLTAKDRLDDKLTGFEAGVDDYLIKPFALADMLARINTLPKPRSGETLLLKVADIELECKLKQVTRAGQILKLPMINNYLLAYCLFYLGITY